MTAVRLTRPCRNGHHVRMVGKRHWPGAMAMLGLLANGGCVTVKAPEAPIVIELNINIKQEVIYRLAGDAGNTIDQNKDIF